ncbi:MAG: class I SAM-dependent methyltransferase [Elusimicrobiota bacterium]
MLKNGYFDSAAATWDDNPRRVELSKSIVSAIRKKVPLSPEMDVFDYGCGTGLLSVLLSPQVRRVTGADSSAGMVQALRSKIARSKIDNIEAVELDLEQGPVPSGRYQLVVSGMALHHVGDVRKVLRAFHELLLAGGYACIADLDSEPGNFHDEQAAATVRHSGFERETVMDMMTEAGFSDCGAVTAFTMNKAIADGTTRDFPVFLITGRK